MTAFVSDPLGICASAIEDDEARVSVEIVNGSGAVWPESKA